MKARLANDHVVLINASGRRIGLAAKMEAHELGLLHRAFSIFLFNENGEMLLQKRASTKYHFAGLWSNSCCGHPHAGERTHVAALRRMQEELNLAVPLSPMGVLTYQFHDSKSNLTEHERDYLFQGSYSGPVAFSRDEVQQVKWLSEEQLHDELSRHPLRYTPWFRLIMQKRKIRPRRMR